MKQVVFFFILSLIAGQINLNHGVQENSNHDGNPSDDKSQDTTTSTSGDNDKLEKYNQIEKAVVELTDKSIGQFITDNPLCIVLFQAPW